jgi:hypothetical protein
MKKRNISLEQVFYVLNMQIKPWELTLCMFYDFSKLCSREHGVLAELMVLLALMTSLSSVQLVPVSLF